MRSFAVYLILAGLLTASHAIADEAGCRAHLPQARQFRANLADIIEGWHDKICGSEPSAGHRTCMLGRLRGNRSSDMIIFSQAWNGCIPGVRDCLRRAAPLMARKPAARAFLRQSCEAGHMVDATESEQRCLTERQARFPKTARKTPAALYPSCIDAIESCSRSLFESQNVRDNERADGDEVLAAAQACRVRSDSDERACVLANIGYVPLTPHGINAALALCSGTTEAQRSCVKDQLISGHVYTAANVDFAKAIEEGLHLCRAEAPIRRCAAELVRTERWQTRVAIGLCDSPSDEATACMKRLLRAGDKKASDAIWKFNRQGADAWNDRYLDAANECRNAGPPRRQEPSYRPPSWWESLGGALR